MPQPSFALGSGALCLNEQLQTVSWLRVVCPGILTDGEVINCSLGRWENGICLLRGLRGEIVPNFPAWIVQKEVFLVVKGEHSMNTFFPTCLRDQKDRCRIALSEGLRF